MTAQREPFALVELAANFADDADVTTMSGLMFAELDMRPTGTLKQRFEDGRVHVFGFVPARDVPVALCTVVAIEHKPGVVVHPPSCNMTQAVARDVETGQHGALEYCATLAGGGVLWGIEAVKVF